MEQAHKGRGRPKTVNGEYNQKKYYDNFKAKHNIQSETCIDCGGKYNYFTKYRHYQTKRHLKSMTLDTEDTNTPSTTPVITELEIEHKPHKITEIHIYIVNEGNQSNQINTSDNQGNQSNTSDNPK